MHLIEHRLFYFCVGKTVGEKSLITIIFSYYFIPLQDDDRTFPFLIVIWGVDIEPSLQ